nr:MAG TPA: hypothetical protein [Caudoviricetes sp.]
MAGRGVIRTTNQAAGAGIAPVPACFTKKIVFCSNGDLWQRNPNARRMPEVIIGANERRKDW